MIRNCKLLLFLIITLIIITGFSCCSKQKNGYKEIEFWTISLKPHFNRYIESLIQQYEATHPKIKIVWVDIPIGAIQQKLLASLAAKKPPAVVNLNPEFTLQFAQMGTLVNIDEMVKDNIRQRYFEGLLNAARLEDGCYALPWYVSTQVIIYNKDIFLKAGLDPNLPPSTWEEVIEYAKIIKDKTKIYGIMPCIKFIDELLLDSIAVVSADGKKALFDSPQAIDKLQIYVELYQKDYIPRDTITLGKSYLRAVEMFQAGSLAMLITGPQFLNRIRDNAPSIYQVTAVAPLPTGKAGIIPASTMNLVIPISTPYKEEAIEFALFVTNDQNQLQFCKIVPVLPSTKKAAADSYFYQSQGDPLMARARTISAQQLPKARALHLRLPNPKQRSDVIQEALEKSLLGIQSPEEALHDAVRKWNLLLKF